MLPKLASLIYILFAMAGCDLAGHTVTVHVTDNGRDRLYSEVTVTKAITVFHCIASSSGACHYVLYDHACPTRGSCIARPFHTFAVPAGERLFDTTLPDGFAPCVRRDAGTGNSVDQDVEAGVTADATDDCPRLSAAHRA